jgi:hypothetical protein
MSKTLTAFDGFTNAQVEGPLDPTLPLVVLLHGLSGTSLDMTDPATGRPGTAFNTVATFPPFVDRGFNVLPPVIPVNGLFLDPPATGLTSWQQALNGAGFSTVVYSQAGPLIANDVAQLTALAAGPLTTDPDLSGLRIVFVAHSRGGLVARAFLSTAATNPALAGFLARVTSVVTLHSPQFGSGVATLGASIDALLARAQTALAVLGIPPPGFLAMLRSMVLSPAIGELVIGTPTAGVFAREPLPGISYHTFGGTSTRFSRLWADFYTPDSFVPFPVPFPLFHWRSSPLVVGIPLDATTFIPAAVLLGPIPPFTELTTVVAALVASTPELAPGSGDVLVTDASSRLPFSTSHTTNFLNHAEALWDPTLQRQVIAILDRLRPPAGPGPAASGQARASIDPFPASTTSAPHTVTAVDAITGAPIPTGSVTVRDTFGSVVLQAALGTPFTFAFRGRRTVTIGPDGERDVEILFPTVDANLPPPYGSVVVSIGR